MIKIIRSIADRVIYGGKQNNANRILIPDHVPEVRNCVVKWMLCHNELLVLTVTLSQYEHQLHSITWLYTTAINSQTHMHKLNDKVLYFQYYNKLYVSLSKFLWTLKCDGTLNSCKITKDLTAFCCCANHNIVPWAELHQTATSWISILELDQLQRMDYSKLLNFLCQWQYLTFVHKPIL